MRDLSNPIRIATILAGVVSLSAADPEVDAKDLSRFPPVEATNTMATFTVKPGFQLELVAAEPLVLDPIETCFDEDGRLFVVDMVDYSERRNEKPHAGCIRLLEDTDGDGRYDTSHVFVDDLPWPTGVLCWGGGIFVAATPDVFYCKDTDGDGRADTRELVYTGFGIDFAPFEVTKLNMQAMLNSLRWGLDNRIHGLTGPNGGELTSPAWTNPPSVNVRGRDFAFDPRTRRLEAEAGGGQYGMSFDDLGHRFTCNNSDHARAFMYEARYAARNPAVALPSSLQSIAADGAAAEVFRRSPDEPWRVIRTRWRVTGLVPGLIEGGGRASGYFTSATGLTVYRGDAWPPEYVGDLFIADCGSNLVHRKRVRRDGVGFVAERPADEVETEFLTSTDTWFRPVQMANAPDGTLHVIDMYREIIEHPWSLPPTLKKHLDLNAGNDRGRIYRIVPDGFRPRAQPRLGAASTPELVQTLAHRNAWHRETAARLLYERQDHTRAVPALEAFLRESPSALGRMHALYALDGQGSLTPAAVLRGLNDADAGVRQHAVRLAEKFVRPDARPAAPEVGDGLFALVPDPSLDVRYQLAFTLGEMSDPRRLDALAELAVRDGKDAWMRAAVLSSLNEGAATLFAALARVPAATEGRGQFLTDLARLIGAQHRDDAVSAVIDWASRDPDPALVLTVVQALGEGLQRARAPMPRERLGAIFAQAALVVTNRTAAESVRLQAAELLGQTTFAESGQLLLGLLSPAQPQSVQLAAIEALGRFADPRVATGLIKGWAAFTPRLREEAMRALLARPDRVLVLLQAFEQGVVRRADLNSTQVQFLTRHREPSVKALATQLLLTAAASPRQEVVESFRPALLLEGDAARGREVFMQRCVSCHRLGGEGFAVGPDLVSVRNAGKDKLLVSILDPGRELLPQFIAYEIETRDGESVLGFIIEETAANLTVRQAYAKETVLPRATILRMNSSGRSIMPDELEAGLTPQAFADLLEFVMTAAK